MLARGFPDPRALSARAWCGVLWTGPLGTAVCYLFWIRALREATVTAVAVTLFVQPLMGALWGALFLGEWLSFRQLLGAGLILAAVAAQAIRAPSSRP
jgi:probable blue pigment (indigoidine) exporter